MHFCTSKSVRAVASDLEVSLRLGKISPWMQGLRRQRSAAPLTEGGCSSLSCRTLAAHTPAPAFSFHHDLTSRSMCRRPHSSRHYGKQHKQREA